MLSVVEDKIAKQGLANVYTKYVDFEKGGSVLSAFALVLSSMTVHHVPNTGMLLKTWQQVLRPRGRVCAADLDTEDDSFPSDNARVFHFGFNHEALKKQLEESGFLDVRDMTATTVVSDVAGAGKREFSVFLIEGQK
jgi:ubiquinone/menaquinone biosynthesis C-methylase UbiE